MRCKGCGYSLFNHRGRTCPECGTPFSPADFEFRPNAVEFCCPGCMQPYYGTDVHGLPEPREFACVSCGAPCELGSMVLRPAPGVGEDEAELQRVPWEDRSLPWRRRFLRTVGEAMVRPGRLGRSIAGSQGGGATRFLLTVALLASVPTALALMAFFGFLGLGAVPPGSRMGAAAVRSDLLELVGSCALGVAVAVGAVLVGALAVAGLATLLLRLMGVDAPWRRTWPAFAYSSAPLVVCAVPCLGPYCGSSVAGVWWMVTAGIALGTSCRASAWRAVAAVVVPVLVVLGLAAAVVTIGVVMPAAAAVKAATAAGAAAPAAGPGSTAPDGSTDTTDTADAADTTDAPEPPDAAPIPPSEPEDSP